MNRLKSYRSKAGFNASELAKKLTMAPSAYRRYERDEVSPKIELCQKIVGFLDCTLNDIWGDKALTPPEHVDISYRAKIGQTILIKINVDKNESKTLKPA